MTEGRSCRPHLEEMLMATKSGIRYLVRMMGCYHVNASEIQGYGDDKAILGFTHPVSLIGS